MKGFIRVLSVLLLSSLAAGCSCSKIGDISLVDYRIENLEPHGMRSISGTVALNLRNNGPTLTFPTLEGEVFRGERRVGSFTLQEPLVIPGPNTSWTDLKAEINLDPEVSVFTIMGMVRKFDASQYQISFDTQVRLGGFKKRIRRDKYPLEKIMKKKDK